MEVIKMTISKNLEGTKLEILLEGRLDTTTSPSLEEELKQSVDGITELVFDFAKLEYISSAGLRILLAAQKVMNKQGSMVIKNVNEVIAEVFEVTGFCDILTIV
jgi:anti-sigma B factor antagonist